MKEGSFVQKALIGSSHLQRPYCGPHPIRYAGCLAFFIQQVLMTGPRVSSLDLLRGAAAFAVAIPHFLLYRHIGSYGLEKIPVLAVEVFFVLSGFVLAPQIEFILRSRSRAILWRFWIRRWMRTVPAYLVALLLASAIFAKIGSADFWRYATYVQNFAWQANTKDYYSIAWSLAVEEWFYLSFPLAMLALTIRLPRVWQAAICIVALVAIIRLGFAPTDNWGSDVRRVVLFRVDAVAYGFLLWFGVRGFKPRLSISFSILLVAGAGCWFALSYVEGDSLARGLYPFLAAAFGSGAILFALSAEGYASRVSKFCEACGTMSYPIYLFHLIAIYLVPSAKWLEFGVARSPVTRKYRFRLRGQLADRWVLWRASASRRSCAC